MTEEEWLSDESSGWLFEHIRRSCVLTPITRARKCRLTAVAMLREHLTVHSDTQVEAVLDAYEQACDGYGKLDDVKEMAQALATTDTNWRLLTHILWSEEAIVCAREVTGYTRLATAVQCRIIRDIFGNTFRPITFSPEWRTDTALSLARQMYESRDFGAMPILADAIQDAGCDDDNVLNHCRDTKQVHVRGCWVVDLVLGKS